MQDTEINKVNAFIPVINNLLFNLKEDTGYALKMEQLEKLVFSPSQQSENLLTEQVEFFLNAELDRLKVTSNLFRNNHKAGAKSFVSAICKELRIMAGKAGIEWLHSLSIEDNKLILSAEVEETIRASFRNVIESESATKLWNLQNELCEKIQQMHSLVKTKTRLEHYNLPQLIDNFFYLDPHTSKIGIVEIDYEGVLLKK
mgnify:CR=1 FL=1